MNLQKRKIYVAILALCASQAFAQSVVVDKSNVQNAATTGGSESTTVGLENTLFQSGQTITGFGNTNIAFGANIFGSYNFNNVQNAGIFGNENDISTTTTGVRAFVFGNNNSITNSTEHTLSMLFGIGLSDNGFYNCIAFGSANFTSGCTANNQFSVGGLTIGNVADGVLDSDAVNLGQVKSLIAASSGGSGSTDLSGVQSQIDANSAQISAVQTQQANTNTKISTLRAVLLQQAPVHKQRKQRRRQQQTM